MQIAAQEARQGHGALAQEIRRIIDEAKAERTSIRRTSSPVPIVRPQGELAALMFASFPKVRLSDMVLDRGTGERLRRLLREQRHLAKLKSHSLHPRRKAPPPWPSGYRQDDVRLGSGWRTIAAPSGDSP